MTSISKIGSVSGYAGALCRFRARTELGCRERVMGLASVFISYRREDTTAGFAALIHDRLAQTVDADVFRDVDNIPPGVDWQEYVRDALGQCEVALVLIGSLWLNATSGDGRRRLDDPKDVLRFEIAEVLGRKPVRVIPVLFGSVKMPAAEQLPEDIQPLVKKNAVYWHLDQTTASQLQKMDEVVRLGPLGVRPLTPGRADRIIHGPPAQIGGAVSARVLALCAELLEEVSSARASREIHRIQMSLQRPAGGPHILADAVQADAALEALDTLAWTTPELRFIRDRVEELRESGPDMQMIELAKWYDRAAAGEFAIPPDKQAELKRLLTARSSAERLGLGQKATTAELRSTADERALAWRQFEASAPASPMAKRAAGEVVRFYEEFVARGS